MQVSDSMGFMSISPNAAPSDPAFLALSSPLHRRPRPPCPPLEVTSPSALYMQTDTEFTLKNMHIMVPLVWSYSTKYV